MYGLKILPDIKLSSNLNTKIGSWLVFVMSLVSLQVREKSRTFLSVSLCVFPASFAISINRSATAWRGPTDIKELFYFFWCQQHCSITLSLSDCSLVKTSCWENKLSRRAFVLSTHPVKHVSSCNDARDWTFSSLRPCRHKLCTLGFVSLHQIHYYLSISLRKCDIPQLLFLTVAIILVSNDT